MPVHTNRCAARYARCLQWIAFVLLLFLIVLSRAPSVLALPSLEVEDGTRVFLHFYQHRGIGELFRVKGGYIPLLANAMGYLSTRLPTEAIPYGLTWLPLLLALAAYGVFFGRRYRAVVPSDASRATICLLFALAPLGQFHLLSHTDYSIWNSFLLLMFMSILPLPAGRAWLTCYWLIQNLLVWSHPLTILILPLQVFLLIQDKPRRKFYAVTVINLLWHQWQGVEGGRAFGGMGLVEIAAEIVKSAIWTVVVVAKTAFRSAFGHPLFCWVEENMWFVLVYWVVLLVMTTTLVLLKHPPARRPIAVILYLVLSVTFLSILSRGRAMAGDIRYAPRYIYLQSLSFLMLFGILADAAVRMLPRVKRSHAASPHSLFSALAGRLDASAVRGMVLVCMLLHYGLLNTQYGHYFVFNTAAWSPYRYSHPDNGRIVQEFFRELAEAEEKHGGRTGFYLVARKRNDWPIELDTRSGEERGEGGEPKSGPRS